MKAQRRHELQENVLDAELGKVIEFFKKYGTYIVWGVLVVVLAVIVAGYSIRNRRQRQREIHARYERAITDGTLAREERLKELKALAEQDRNMDVAAQACVAVADEYAWRVTTLSAPMAMHRAALAKQADTHYRKAISKFPDRPEIVGRARVGLARLAETGRDFQGAKAEYEMVLAMPKLRAGPLADAAEVGLSVLKDLGSPVVMATTAPAPRSNDERR